jgi:hypothetical protein
MDTLRADFLRYSKQHSWYKHIPITGDDFNVYQASGPDDAGLHWHFYRFNKPQDIDSNTPIYTVRFGPFLQGVHTIQCGGKLIKNAYSLNLIMSCNEETFLPWIAENYPDMIRTWDDWSRMNSENPTVVKLFEKEQEKYWVNLLTVVRNNECFYLTA